MRFFSVNNKYIFANLISLNICKSGGIKMKLLVKLLTAFFVSLSALFSLTTIAKAEGEKLVFIYHSGDEDFWWNTIKNTLKQAEETIQESNKNNIKPIIFIKYYIVKGFGVDWIKALQLLLASSFPQNSFKLYVDANTDYGLSIELISIKINYIKIT